MKTPPLLALFLLPTMAFSQIPLSNGVPYAQNFNGMTAGDPFPEVYSDVVDPPAGWAVTGNAANLGDGGERALGTEITTPTSFGATFQIQTGGPQVDLEIHFTGEQWYQAASHPASWIDFEYSTDATSLSTGTWTAFDPLDYQHSGLIMPLGDRSTNGNDASFREAREGTISLADVPDGQVVWIRWTAIAVPGSLSAGPRCNGLSVDDFSITATATAGLEPVKILTISHDPAANLTTITYQSIDGVALGVRGGTDLADLTDVLPDTVPGNGSILSYTHTPPADTPRYFYRFLRPAP